MRIFGVLLACTLCAGPAFAAMEPDGAAPPATVDGAASDAPAASAVEATEAPLVDVASLRTAIDPFAEPDATVEEMLPTFALPGVRPVGFTVAPPRLVVTVSLSSQEMSVRLDGEEVHHWPVSTGRRGYATPPGAYQPYRYATMWRSRQYDGAEMPYSIFFHGGYAIHGTRSVRHLGAPASHGCVRLATENAKTLFDLARDIGSAEVSIVVEN